VVLFLLMIRRMLQAEFVSLGVLGILIVLLTTLDAFTIPSSSNPPRPATIARKTEFLRTASLSTFCLNISPSPADKISTIDTNELGGDKSESTIRPLHQNWWPVSVSTALDKSRPNAIELLGMRLVLFHDSESGEWKCLEDMCPHRFAPLSEGRIIVSDANSNENVGSGNCSSKTCIQCAYHGWEFDVQGSCTRLPQREEDQAKNQRKTPPPVRSFQVQSDVEIIWVWADPDTKAFSQIIPLPISPLLRRWHEEYGDGSAFMRDLPYGMELLGENLLDLSHLPYSHHSLGFLNRDLGGPLPLRMLSETEKEKEAEWEMKYEKCAGGKPPPVLPIFQVEVINASKCDPILLGFSKLFPVPANSTCTIGYYAPCHVRYRRVISGRGSQHVELFMAPTKAGESRVFLFNPSEALLPPLDPPEKEKATFKSLIAAISPTALKSKVRKRVMKRLFIPTSSRSHMMNHQIFDGDGIFLNKQGDRMRRSDSTFKDYFTPTNSDVLVTAFRRYLDRAARKTKEVGHTLASSTVSTLGSDNREHYVDNNDRARLLDRYESHTAHCPVCSKALEKSKRWYKRWCLVQTAFVGAAGSCTTVLTATAAVSLFGVSVPAILIPTSGTASVLSIVGAAVADRIQKFYFDRSQKFYFEDYIHAEKN